MYVCEDVCGVCGVYVCVCVWCMCDVCLCVVYVWYEHAVYV